MIHACTKDQIFLCHLKFTLWVSQTSPPGDVFSFYVLFTHFRSCDNIILLENWCFFQLSSHLHAHLYACMYCMHNLQTVKLEILLRLGKQNMQAQDFYCRNHFGHHGRKKKFWLLILQSVRDASLGTCVWIIWRKLWFFITSCLCSRVNWGKHSQCCPIWIYFLLLEFSGTLFFLWIFYFQGLINCFFLATKWWIHTRLSSEPYRYTFSA